MSERREVVRRTVYTFHALLAERWRARRCFLLVKREVRASPVIVREDAGQDPAQVPFVQNKHGRLPIGGHFRRGRPRRLTRGDTRPRGLGFGTPRAGILVTGR
jgi:hypothetical protein